MVGLIGTSCSVATAVASPILSEVGLAMISSSNTSPSLTSDFRGNAESSYFPGYYRTASNDLQLAWAVAEFSYFDLYNHKRPHQTSSYRTPAEEQIVL